jgi:hypothetical protein
MKYVRTSVGSTYYPKILGVYEKELHSIIERLCLDSFDSIVNVGAAEGYYSVGFALRSPRSKHVAFETTKDGQHLVKQMAVMNGVDGSIEVFGQCNPSDLNNLLSTTKKTLIIMDVEGAELSLLDQKLCQKLSECYILVELHDFLDRTLGSTIAERFKASHVIEEVWSRERTVDDFSIKMPGMLRRVLKYRIIPLMSESRGEPMRWYFMTPLDFRISL